MDNTIYITDEDGREKVMQILFTFDMNEKKYVVVFEQNNEEDLYAFTYDEEGNLQVIDDEEMEMVEEVIGAFEDGEDEEA